MTPAVERLNFIPDARVGASAKVQMAPLIDIVFLLICFYLLVAQMVTNQKDLSVNLPTMHAAEAAELPAEVVINLRPDGEVSVNGELLPMAALEALLSAEARQASVDGRPLRVVIRADYRQRYEKLDQILGVCRRTGLERVVLRAREGDQP